MTVLHCGSSKRVAFAGGLLRLGYILGLGDLAENDDDGQQH
jgi:hypothetical protein